MSVVTILNAIRQTATDAYQNTVPLATMENFAHVGASVLNAPDTIKNEFLTALVNKIGLQLFNEKEFGNPLSFLQKGTLAYGQTIEDIFIEMSKPFEYKTGTRVADPETGELEAVPDQYSINKSIANTAYYYNIFGRQYWQTIHEDDLSRAFTSGDGLGRLISAIMLSMKNGENYDDYRMAIAIIARQIEEGSKNNKWNGMVNLLTLYNSANGTTLTADDALSSKDFLKFMSNSFKKWSNRLTKPRQDLNNAGVTNWVPASSQRIMMLSDIQADIDTNLMAWAYNNDRLEIGAIDQIDSWYSIGVDSGGTATPDNIEVKGTLGITTGTGENKKDVPVLAVLYDPAMVKIYNRTRKMTQAFNARGLYYNVFSTVEDIYAASPFHNFVVFSLV